MTLARRRLAELPLGEKGLLPPNSWTWEEFAAVAAQTPLETLPAPPAVPENESLPIASSEPDEPAVAGEIAAGEDKEESATSCGTSSSASDVSAEAEELLGIVPPEEISETLQWFQQGKKVHITRAEDDDRYRPWCRDSGFAQDPVRSGVGFFTMEKDRVCQRCLSRMPRALYVALSDHCGWLH